jgi:multidrug efflux pump
VGAILALLLTGNDLGVVALIGIILLIGIVKKNATMMTSRWKRNGWSTSRRKRPSSRPACCVSSHHDDHGGAAGRASAGAGEAARVGIGHPLGITTIVGGLLVSQLLTLYTTPVVYLWFDRLAQRFSHLNIGNSIEEPSGASAD